MLRPYEPQGGKWRISMLEAARPQELNPASAAPILGPEDIGAEGVNDPYVLAVGAGWYMIGAYAPTPRVHGESPAAMHASGGQVRCNAGRRARRNHRGQVRHKPGGAIADFG